MSGETLSRERGLSAAALKWIALITMTLDHFAASGLFELLAYGRGMEWEWISRNYMTLRYIGRLAFPIYCFLLVEGFHHTHSRKRYALRLGLFALISELPFNLAVSGVWWDAAFQNVFFTLLLGLLALMFAAPLYEKREQRKAFVLVLAFALAAELLRTDYGFFGVALIAALYFLRQRVPEKYLVSGALLLGLGSTEIAALPSLLLMHLYNGRQGRQAKWLRQLFYWYYPAHLLVFGLLVRFAC